MEKVKYADLNPEHEWVKRAAFWGDEGQESLTDTDIDDCILYLVEDFDDFDVTIDVYAFVPQAVQVDATSNILEPLLELLDDEYGDPDGGYSKPTTGMVEVAEYLAHVVETEYTAWACESIGIVEVDVLAWVKEHEPEWLEDKYKLMEKAK